MVALVGTTNQTLAGERLAANARTATGANDRATALPATGINVPVYVHIVLVGSTAAKGNVSDATVAAQIAVGVCHNSKKKCPCGCAACSSIQDRRGLCRWDKSRNSPSVLLLWICAALIRRHIHQTAALPSARHSPASALGWWPLQSGRHNNPWWNPDPLPPACCAATELGVCTDGCHLHLGRHDAHQQCQLVQCGTGQPGVDRHDECTPSGGDRTNTVLVVQQGLTMQAVAGPDIHFLPMVSIRAGAPCKCSRVDCRHHSRGQHLMAWRAWPAGWRRRSEPVPSSPGELTYHDAARNGLLQGIAASLVPQSAVVLSPQHAAHPTADSLRVQCQAYPLLGWSEFPWWYAGAPLQVRAGNTMMLHIPCSRSFVLT